jgi:hypothetical protein
LPFNAHQLKTYLESNDFAEALVFVFAYLNHGGALGAEAQKDTRAVAKIREQAITLGVALEGGTLPSDAKLAQPLLMLLMLDHLCAPGGREYTAQANANPARTFKVPTPAGAGAGADSEYWLLPFGSKQPERLCAHSRDRTHMLHWLQHHQIVRAEDDQGHRVQTAVLNQGDPADRVLAAWGRTDYPFKVAHGVPVDGQTITYEVPPPSTYFQVTGLTDSSVRSAAILALLGQARADKADVLLLPEYGADAACVQALRDALSKAQAEFPRLVIIGHFVVDGDKTTNYAEVLLGESGATVLMHAKLTAVVFTPPESELAETRPDDEPAKKPTPLTENIKYGNDIHLLPTPLGVMSAAVCKDIFDPPAKHRWHEAAPAWVWVVSMSDSISPHQSAAKTLASTEGVKTHVANIAMPPADKPAPFGFGVEHGESEDASTAYHLFEPLPPVGPQKPPALRRVK